MTWGQQKSEYYKEINIAGTNLYFYNISEVKRFFTGFCVSGVTTATL